MIKAAEEAYNSSNKIYKARVPSSDGTFKFLNLNFLWGRRPEEKFYFSDLAKMTREEGYFAFSFCLKKFWKLNWQLIYELNFDFEIFNFLTRNPKIFWVIKNGLSKVPRTTAAVGLFVRQTIDMERTLLERARKERNEARREAWTSKNKDFLLNRKVQKLEQQKAAIAAKWSGKAGRKAKNQMAVREDVFTSQKIDKKIFNLKKQIKKLNKNGNDTMEESVRAPSTLLDLCRTAMQDYLKKFKKGKQAQKKLERASFVEKNFEKINKIKNDFGKVPVFNRFNVLEDFVEKKVVNSAPFSYKKDRSAPRPFTPKVWKVNEVELWNLKKKMAYRSCIDIKNARSGKSFDFSFGLKMKNLRFLISQDIERSVLKFNFVKTYSSPSMRSFILKKQFSQGCYRNMPIRKPTPRVASRWMKVGLFPTNLYNDTTSVINCSVSYCRNRYETVFQRKISETGHIRLENLEGSSAQMHTERVRRERVEKAFGDYYYRQFITVVSNLFSFIPINIKNDKRKNDYLYSLSIFHIFSLFMHLLYFYMYYISDMYFARFWHVISAIVYIIICFGSNIDCFSLFLCWIIWFILMFNLLTININLFMFSLFMFCNVFLYINIAPLFSFSARKLRKSVQQSWNGAHAFLLRCLGNTKAQNGMLHPAEGFSQDDNLNGIAPDRSTSVPESEVKTSKIRTSFKKEKYIDVEKEFNWVLIKGQEHAAVDINKFGYFKYNRFVTSDAQRQVFKLRAFSRKSCKIGDNTVRFKNKDKFSPFDLGKFKSDLVNRTENTGSLDNVTRANKRLKIKSVVPNYEKINLINVCPKTLTHSWTSKKFGDNTRTLDFNWGLDGSFIREYCPKTYFLRQYKQVMSDESIVHLDLVNFGDNQYLYKGKRHVNCISTDAVLKFPAHIVGRNPCLFVVKYYDEVFGPFKLEQNHIDADCFIYTKGGKTKVRAPPTFYKKDETKYIKIFNDNRETVYMSQENIWKKFHPTNSTVNGFRLYRFDGDINTMLSGTEIDKDFMVGTWYRVKGTTQIFAMSQQKWDGVETSLDLYEKIETSGRGRRGTRGAGRGGRGRPPVKPVTIKQTVVEVPTNTNKKDKDGKPIEKNAQYCLSTTLFPLPTSARVHPENLGRIQQIQPVGTRPVRGRINTLVTDAMRNMRDRAAEQNRNRPSTNGGVFETIKKSIGMNTDFPPPPPPISIIAVSTIALLILTCIPLGECASTAVPKYLERVVKDQERNHHVFERSVSDEALEDVCNVYAKTENNVELFGGSSMEFKKSEVYYQECSKCIVEKNCPNTCWCDNFIENSHSKTRTTRALKAVNVGNLNCGEVRDLTVKMFTDNREQLAPTGINMVKDWCNFIKCGIINPGIPCSLLESQAFHICDKQLEGRLHICSTKRLDTKNAYHRVDNDMQKLFEYAHSRKAIEDDHVQFVERPTAGSAFGSCQQKSGLKCLREHADDILKSNDPAIYEKIYRDPEARKLYREKNYKGSCTGPVDDCRWMFWLELKWDNRINKTGISCEDIKKIAVEKYSKVNHFVYKTNLECSIRASSELQKLGNIIISDRDNYVEIIVQTSQFNDFSILSAKSMTRGLVISTTDPNLNIKNTEMNLVTNNVEIIFDSKIIRILNGLMDKKIGNCLSTFALNMKDKLYIYWPKMIYSWWAPVVTYTFNMEPWQCESRSKICNYGNPPLEGKLMLPVKFIICEHFIHQSSLRLQEAFDESNQKFSDLIDQMIDNPVELFLGQAPDSELPIMINKLWKSMSSVGFIDYLLIALAMLLFIMPWTKPLAAVVMIAWLGMKISVAQSLDANSACGAVDVTSVLNSGQMHWFNSIDKVEGHKCYRFAMVTNSEKMLYCNFHIKNIKVPLGLNSPIYIPINYSFNRHHGWSCPGGTTKLCTNARCAFNQDWAYVTKCTNVYSSGVWDFGCAFVGQVKVCDVFALEILSLINSMSCYKIHTMDSISYDYEYMCGSGKEEKYASGTAQIGTSVDTTLGSFKISDLVNKYEAPYNSLCIDNSNGKIYLIETDIRRDGVIWSLKIDAVPSGSDAEIPHNFIEVQRMKPNDVKYDFIKNNAQKFLVNNFAINASDDSIISYEYKNGVFEKLEYHPRYLPAKLEFTVLNSVVLNWSTTCAATECSVKDITKRDIKLKKQLYKIHMSCNTVVAGTDKFGLMHTDHCEVIAGQQVDLTKIAKHTKAGILEESTSFTFTIACDMGFKEISFDFCKFKGKFNVSAPYWDVYTMAITSWKTVEETWQNSGSDIMDSARKWLKSTGLMSLFNLSLHNIIIYFVSFIIVYITFINGYILTSIILILIMFSFVYVSADNVDFLKQEDLKDGLFDNSSLEIAMVYKWLKRVYESLVNSPLYKLLFITLQYIGVAMSLICFVTAFNARNIGIKNFYVLLVIFTLLYMVYGGIPNPFLLGYLSYPTLNLSFVRIKYYLNFSRNGRGLFYLPNLIIILFLYSLLPSVASISECRYAHACNDCGVGQKLLYLNNVNWTLHGYWEETSHCNGSYPSLSYDDFTKKFNRSFVQQHTVSFLKADFTNKYCCHQQFREYLNHAAKCGKTYEWWYDKMTECIDKFNFENIKPVHCTYCKLRDWNMPWESTDNLTNIEFQGCKAGRPISYNGYCSGKIFEYIFVKIPNNFKMFIRYIGLLVHLVLMALFHHEFNIGSLIIILLNWGDLLFAEATAAPVLYYNYIENSNFNSYWNFIHYCFVISLWWIYYNRKNSKPNVTRPKITITEIGGDLATTFDFRTLEPESDRLDYPCHYYRGCNSKRGMVINRSFLIVPNPLGCKKFFVKIGVEPWYDSNGKLNYEPPDEFTDVEIIQTGRMKFADMVGEDKIEIQDRSLAYGFITLEEVNEVRCRLPIKNEFECAIHRCSIDTHNTIYHRFQALVGLKPRLSFNPGKIGNIVRINHAGRSKYGFVYVCDNTREATLVTCHHDGGNNPIFSRQIEWMNANEYTLTGDLACLYPNLINYEKDISFYGKPFKFIEPEIGERYYVFIPHGIAYSGKVGCIAIVTPYEMKRSEEVKNEKGITIKFRKAWKFFDPCMNKFYNPKKSQVLGMSGLPIYDKHFNPVGILSTFMDSHGDTAYIDRLRSYNVHEGSCIDGEAKALATYPQGQIKFITLPTGTGKSTLLPLKLYSDYSMNYGQPNSVLVLNPLINSVEQLHRYMRDVMKCEKVEKASSVETTLTGNPDGITYMTYGYINANSDFAGIFTKYDFVLFDEYHTMDQQVIVTMIKLNELFQKSSDDPELMKKLPRVGFMTATDFSGSNSTGLNLNPKITNIQVVDGVIHEDDMYHPKLHGDNILRMNSIEVYGMPIRLDDFKDSKKYCIFVPTHDCCTTLANWIKKKRPHFLVKAYYRGCGTKPNDFQSQVQSFNGTCVIIATNYIASGVTIDFDEVWDTRKRIVVDVSWDDDRTQFVRKMHTVTVTPAEAIQRAGRVGRFKPGVYKYVIPCDPMTPMVTLEDIFNAICVVKFEKEGQILPEINRFLMDIITDGAETELILLFDTLLDLAEADQHKQCKKVVDLCKNLEYKEKLPLWVKVLNVCWNCASIDMKGAYAPVPPGMLMHNVTTCVAYDSRMPGYAKQDPDNVRRWNAYVEAIKDYSIYQLIAEDEDKSIANVAKVISTEWIIPFIKRYNKEYMRLSPERVKILNEKIFSGRKDAHLTISNAKSQNSLKSDKKTLDTLSSFHEEVVKQIETDGIEKIQAEDSSGNVVAISLAGASVAGLAFMSWVKRRACGLIEESWVLANDVTFSQCHFWDWMKDQTIMSYFESEAVVFRDSNEVAMPVFEETLSMEDDNKSTKSGKSDSSGVIKDYMRPEPKISDHQANQINVISDVCMNEIQSLEEGKSTAAQLPKLHQQLTTIDAKISEVIEELDEYPLDEIRDETCLSKYSKADQDFIREVFDKESNLLKQKATIINQIDNIKNSKAYRNYLTMKTAKERNVPGVATDTGVNEYVEQIKVQLGRIEWEKLSNQAKEQIVKHYKAARSGAEQYVSALQNQSKKDVDWMKWADWVSQYAALFGTSLCTMNFDKFVQTFGMIPTCVTLGAFTCVTTLSIGSIKTMWLLLGTQFIYSCMSDKSDFTHNGFYNFVTSHTANFGTWIFLELTQGNNPLLLSFLNTIQERGLGSAHWIMHNMPVVSGMLTSSALYGTFAESATSVSLSVAINVHKIMSSVIHKNFDEDSIASTSSILLNCVGSNVWDVFRGFLIGTVATIIELIIISNEDVFRKILKVVVKGNFMDREMYKEFADPKNITKTIHWVMVGLLLLMDPKQIIQVALSYLFGWARSEHELNFPNFMKAVDKTAGLSLIVWIMQECYKWFKFINKDHKERMRPGVEVSFTSASTVENLITSSLGVITELAKLPYELCRILFVDIWNSTLFIQIRVILRGISKIWISYVNRKGKELMMHTKCKAMNWMHTKVAPYLNPFNTDLMCNITFEGKVLSGEFNWDLSNTTLLDQRISRVRYFGYCGRGEKYDVVVEHTGLCRYESFNNSQENCCEKVPTDRNFRTLQEVFLSIPDGAYVLIQMADHLFNCSRKPKFDNKRTVQLIESQRSVLKKDFSKLPNYGYLDYLRAQATAYCMDVGSFNGYCAVCWTCISCGMISHKVLLGWRKAHLALFEIHSWGCQASTTSVQELKMLNSHILNSKNTSFCFYDGFGNILGSVVRNMLEADLKFLSKKHQFTLSDLNTDEEGFTQSCMIVTTNAVTERNLIVNNGTYGPGIFSIAYDDWIRVGGEISNYCTYWKKDYCITNIYQEWSGAMFFDKKFESFQGLADNIPIKYKEIEIPVAKDFREDGEEIYYYKRDGQPVKVLEWDGRTVSFGHVIDNIPTEEGIDSYTFGYVHAVYTTFKKNPKYDQIRLFIEQRYPMIHEWIGPNLKNLNVPNVVVNIKDYSTELWTDPTRICCQLRTLNDMLTNNAMRVFVNLKKWCRSKFNERMFTKDYGLVNTNYDLQMDQLDLRYSSKGSIMFNPAGDTEEIELQSMSWKIWSPRINIKESSTILNWSKRFEADSPFMRRVYSIIYGKDMEMVDVDLFEFQYKVLHKLVRFKRNFEAIKLSYFDLCVVTESSDIVFHTNDEYDELVPQLEQVQSEGSMVVTNRHVLSMYKHGIKEFVFDGILLPATLDDYFESMMGDYYEYYELVTLMQSMHWSRGVDPSWMLPVLPCPDVFVDEEDYQQWRAEVLELKSEEDAGSLTSKTSDTLQSLIIQAKSLNSPTKDSIDASEEIELSELSQELKEEEKQQYIEDSYTTDWKYEIVSKLQEEPVKPKWHELNFDYEMRTIEKAEKKVKPRLKIDGESIRASFIISMDHNCKSELEVIKILGDGNCCFRALSMAIFGTEMKWNQIKIMLKNQNITNQQFDFYEILDRPGAHGSDDHILAFCFLFKMNFCEHSRDGTVFYRFKDNTVNDITLHMKHKRDHWDLLVDRNFDKLSMISNDLICDLIGSKSQGVMRTDDRIDYQVEYENKIYEKEIDPGEDLACDTAGGDWLNKFSLGLFGINKITKSQESQAAIYTVNQKFQEPNPRDLVGNNIKGIPKFSNCQYYKECDTVESIEYDLNKINILRQRADCVTQMTRSMGNKIWYEVCRAGKHERPDAGDWVSRGAFKMHELDDIYHVVTWGTSSMWLAEGRGGFVQMYMSKVSNLKRNIQHSIFVCTGWDVKRERPFIVDGYDIPKNVNYKHLQFVDSNGVVLFENDIRHSAVRRGITSQFGQYVDFICSDGGESGKTQQEAAKDLDDYIIAILDMCYLKLKNNGHLIIKLNDVFCRLKQLGILLSHFKHISTWQSPSQVNCSQEIYLICFNFGRHKVDYMGLQDLKNLRVDNLFDDSKMGMHQTLLRKIWGSKETIYHLQSIDKCLFRYSIAGGQLLNALGKITKICKDKVQIMEYELLNMKTFQKTLKPLNYPMPISKSMCITVNPKYKQDHSIGLWSVTNDADGNPIPLLKHSVKNTTTWLSKHINRKYGCYWAKINGVVYHDVQEELFRNFCEKVGVPFDSEQYPGTENLRWYGKTPMAPKYGVNKLQVMSVTGDIVKSVINNCIDVLPVGMASKTRESWLESVSKKLNVKHRRLAEHDVVQCISIGKQISYYNHEPWGLMSWEEIGDILKKKASSGWLEDNRLYEIWENPVKRIEIDEKLKKVMNGEVVDVTWSANHKREARSGVDMKFPPPRIIQFMDGESRLLFLRLIGYIQTQHNLKQKMYWGSNTGRSLTHVGDYLHDEWKKYKDPVGIMIDIKSWDTNVTCEELCCMCECFKPHFKKELHTGIETYFKMLLSPLVIDLEGNCFARVGQVSSGEITTSRGNGWLNITRCTQMVMEATGYDFQWVKDHVTMCCEGDDLTMIMEYPVGQRVLAYSKKFLVRVNKPPKIVDENGYIRFTKNFLKLEFCSHTYQPVPINDKVHYLPHKPLPEILGKMALTKKIAGCKYDTPISRELNRSKAISYLLLYPGQPIIRRIALLVLSKVGWGNYDTKEFEYIFGHLQGSNSLMAAVRSVYGSDVKELCDIGYFPQRVIQNDWHSVQQYTLESVDQYEGMYRCVKAFISDSFDVNVKRGKIQSIRVTRNLDMQPIHDLSFISMDRFLFKMVVKDWRVKFLLNNISDSSIEKEAFVKDDKTFSIDHIRDVNAMNTKTIEELMDKFYNIFCDTSKEIVNADFDLVIKGRASEIRHSKLGKGEPISEHALKTLTFAKERIENIEVNYAIKTVIRHDTTKKFLNLISRGLVYLGGRVTITVKE